MGALVLLPAIPGGACASLRRVPCAPGAAAEALRSASAGDTLLLASGVHRGPLVLTRPVTLRGERGAVLDGGGRGSVLTVAAGGCVIEDLEIRGSGARVISIDAGVRVVSSPDVRLRGLRLRDVLYGVYAERSDRLSVEAVTLEGRADPASGRGEGNGIHLWSCAEARVRACEVRRFVDGVYLSFTHRATFRGNRLEESARYGFHTMYCQENRLIQNRFAFNVAGCAIMFSNGLEVISNEFAHNRGPRTYGLLLRDCSDGRFQGNLLIDNTIAMFLDGSNRNRFEGNLIQDNGWGILLFSSSDGNVFAKNSVLNNDYPVALDMRYTDNRFDDGTAGNYWSENTPYDLNADGISDVPYSPVSAFAFLSKQYPDLSVLARSPAVAALSVAERVLPALRPSEAVDRFPLARPARALGAVHPPTAARRRAWAPAFGFLLLGALGLAGIAIARRPA
jgi:nitrous oxidase accessory protein